MVEYLPNMYELWVLSPDAFPIIEKKKRDGVGYVVANGMYMPKTCKAMGWIPSTKEGGREEGGNKEKKADIHFHVNALYDKVQMLGLEPSISSISCYFRHSLKMAVLLRLCQVSLRLSIVSCKTGIITIAAS